MYYAMQLQCFPPTHIYVHDDLYPIAQTTTAHGARACCMHAALGSSVRKARMCMYVL